MDVLGLGVLIAGESGIGKSECALDLIVRGHRLVADDTVEVRRRAETILIGTCPELTRHHMELRGLGVINVKELFGIASIRSSKRVELVVQLERWVPAREYERLGLDDEFYEILGLRVPLIRMPVAPGRNIAILVEVAARNQLLRARGHHAARLLADRLERVAPALGRIDRRRRRGRPRAWRRRMRAASTGRSTGGAAPAVGAAAAPKAASQPFAASRLGAAVHRHHRAVGIRQVAGDPRARGSRLLLRRQPADEADPHARAPVARAATSQKVAIVVDVREGTFLSSFPAVLRRLRKMRGLNPVLIFLEASNAALVRRFSETRRPHPLAPGRSPAEGIKDERARTERHPRDGRRDRRHLRHDGPRAPPVLHGPVAGPRQGPAGRSRCSASATSTACRSTPTSSSTRAACRIRTSCRRCATGRDGIGRWSRSWSAMRSTRAVHRAPRRLPALRRAALRGGGKDLPDDCHRLHRRPPPLGDDRGAAEADPRGDRRHPGAGEAPGHHGIVRFRFQI